MEFDQQSIMAGTIIAAVCLLAIWFLDFSAEGLAIKYKILFTVFCVPVSYLVAALMNG